VNDPHMHARGTLRRIVHPELGEVVLPTGPMLFSGSEQPELVPSKAVGADNADVFGEWLGIDADQLKSLQAAGAF
jgi:CoA:oxalate CoA-transferase